MVSRSDIPSGKHYLLAIGGHCWRVLTWQQKTALINVSAVRLVCQYTSDARLIRVYRPRALEIDPQEGFEIAKAHLSGLTAIVPQN